MDFEAVKARVAGAAQTGMAKAKDLVEIGKLKVANAAEQDTIRKAYMELGKLYFAQRGMDPEPPFAALCAKIVESRERIAYNDERITDIRQAGGISQAEVDAVPAEDFAEEPVDAPADEPADPQE